MPDDVKVPRMMSIEESIARAYAQESPAASQDVRELAAKYGLEIGTSQFEVLLAQFRTKDPAMLKQKEILRAVAGRAEPVLITGPTGTGKELFARALGGARHGPFVAINCAAMPDTLLESELFGHVKGAFTGAAQDHPGLIEQAGGGTMFLDEIGELSPAAQAKLLRVIQERTLRRVGSVATVPVSCRFVAATKNNIKEMVSNGAFREDLYYRLAVWEISTTPLEMRPCDVDLLAAAFDWDTETDGPIPAEALTGNVRSLQTWILRKQVLPKE